MQLRTISMNGTDTTKGKEPDTPKVTCTTTNTLDEEERAELNRLRAQQQNCSALTTLYAKHGEMLKVLDNQTTVEEFAQATAIRRASLDTKSLVHLSTTSNLEVCHQKRNNKKTRHHHH